ncbi:hypothetical protein AN214_04334 [Pseudoalteromonas sp. P1-9]|uniref:hypothetical protein n=1 Tax=Pseudoalteromonas sp. P1-9 TaxID=1710354 RepID=UPI0006D5DAEA|nr:hypothetical protein [Pseudoalteromonas sp. P1-9]KPV93623.1 hypothetical protein AN214_04334 [Pseudoalteromonas sp. P1-9]
MNNKAKSIFLVLVFAVIYAVVLQQGILLLTDYLQVGADSLISEWQTALGLFVFNLLVAQTTRKYFKTHQRLLFSLTVGFASALLPTLFAYQLALIWPLLLANVVISILALLAQSKLELLHSKSQ